MINTGKALLNFVLNPLGGGFVYDAESLRQKILFRESRFSNGPSIWYKKDFDDGDERLAEVEADYGKSAKDGEKHANRLRDRGHSGVSMQKAADFRKIEAHYKFLRGKTADAAATYRAAAKLYGSAVKRLRDGPDTDRALYSQKQCRNYAEIAKRAQSQQAKRESHPKRPGDRKRLREAVSEKPRNTVKAK